MYTLLTAESCEFKSCLPTPCWCDWTCFLQPLSIYPLLTSFQRIIVFIGPKKFDAFKHQFAWNSWMETQLVLWQRDIVLFFVTGHVFYATWWIKMRQYFVVKYRFHFNANKKMEYWTGLVIEYTLQLRYRVSDQLFRSAVDYKECVSWWWTRSGSCAGSCVWGPSKIIFWLRHWHEDVEICFISI